MKGKAKIAALVAVTAAALVFGALVIPRSEAAGPRSTSDIPLTATFRENVSPQYPADKILGDGMGPYVHIQAYPPGPVSVHLDNGRFLMSLDNAGDLGTGRSVGFLFDQWVYSCTVDSRQDSELYKDFATGPGAPVVRTRWVSFRTWYRYVFDPNDGYYHESLESLDFRALKPGELAYVGMSINFNMTVAGGSASDEYYLGFMRDPVEVEALSFDGNGVPNEWAIRTIQDPNVYTKIHENFYLSYVPTRMLLQLHYPLGKKRNVGYQSQCYGHYSLPFELHLTR